MGFKGWPSAGGVEACPKKITKTTEIGVSGEVDKKMTGRAKEHRGQAEFKPGTLWNPQVTPPPTLPCKYERLTQHCFNGGPASATLSHH